MKRIWTVPNILSMFRIVCVALMIGAFCAGKLIVAMTIFIVAILTDLVDGFIARRYNQITDLGKLLDPLADKLLVLSALVAFYALRILPLWVVAIAIAKEVVMIVGAAFCLKKKDIVVFSNLFGKIAATVFYLAIILTFLHQYVAPWHMVAMVVALVMSILAMVQYGIITLMRTRGRA